MERIASFTVDHTVLTPGLYLSRQDGDAVTLDLRFKKPNTGDLLTNAEMHSVEHLIATLLRNAPEKDAVLYFGPMGCQTGFYFLFDRRKLDERIRQVRQQWGNTPAYREYEEKARQRTAQQEQALADEMMGIFREIGMHLGQAPDSEPVQELVRKLQAYITEHFYECTPKLFRCLGKMYVGGGELTQSIDAAGGPGTAQLAGEAIELYCRDAE